MQDLHRAESHEWRLFGGFGDHSIACGQGGRDLPQKDRQRKVPRADTGPDPARLHIGACLGGVVAQKIHRLAQFGHGIGQGLARLARQQREERVGVCFQRIGGLAQHRRAGGVVGGPDRGTGQRIGHVGGGGGCHLPHSVVGLCGVDDGGRTFLPPAGIFGLGRCQGSCDETGVMQGRAGLVDSIQRGLMRQVPAFGIDPCGREKCGSGRQVGARACCVERAGGDDAGGDGLVYDLVDEAGIGPVFQQAADKIGQQIFVRADGGIDPAAGVFGVQHDCMQCFAHTVQALELECVLAAPHLGRHVQHGGHGMRVMGGELRIDPVGQAQKFACSGDIADVGMLFGGEDGEAVDPLHLRAFDFGVPIGAFDQPDHDLAVQIMCHLVKLVDHQGRALPIGLHDHPEPVPFRQCWIGQHGADDVQRQGQPVGLFRVDVEPHAGGFRQERQRTHARHQFFHHPRLLRHLVARMQRREFDRNAGVFRDRAMHAMIGNGGYRAGIGQVVVFGVGFGAGRFAQHVIAIGKPFGLHAVGAFHRLLNRFAQHELPPHFAHCAADSGADHRFAQPFDGGPQVPRDPRLFIIQHTACQHQRPSRGIHQRGRGMPQMFAPIGWRDLVLDQIIHRVGVGHAQQSFGQTHQRDAFVGRKAVFGEEDLHQPRIGAGADLGDKRRRAVADPGAVGVGQGGGFHQACHGCGFVAVDRGVDGITQSQGSITGHGGILIQMSHDSRL